MKKLVAVTGGIGCGKSVVCQILSSLGYAIYDCDSRAKSLMDNSIIIKEQIADQIDTSVIQNGEIDRILLGKIVFNDKVALSKLNKIVHYAVINDLQKWHSETFGDIHFVETAILYQSGIDKLVNSVIEVCAPIELRIKRVMKRNRLTREEVISRINSQVHSIENIHQENIIITNDNVSPILCQLLSALNIISR